MKKHFPTFTFIITIFLLVFPLNAFATSRTIDFNVYSAHGVKNFSKVELMHTLANGTPIFTNYQTDGYGKTSIKVEDGDRLRFSRDPGTGGCKPPEQKGVEFNVTSSTPSRVDISLPKMTSRLVDPSLSKVEDEVIGLINKERTDKGLSKVEESRSLNKSADAFAGYTADHISPSNFSQFDHCLGIGGPWSRVIEWGYPVGGASIGEITASGTALTPDRAVKAWMASSGHKAQILTDGYKYIGVGQVNHIWMVNFSSDCPVAAQDRCELTGNKGSLPANDPAPDPNPDNGGSGSGGQQGDNTPESTDKTPTSVNPEKGQLSPDLVWGKVGKVGKRFKASVFANPSATGTITLNATNGKQRYQKSCTGQTCKLNVIFRKGKWRLRVDFVGTNGYENQIILMKKKY